MKVFRTAIGIVAAGLSASSALAATGSVETTTQSTLDRIQLGYYGMYYGSPLNRPFDSLQPGEDSSRTELYSTFTAGYQFDDGSVAYVQPRWDTQFVRGTTVSAEELRVGLKKSGPSLLKVGAANVVYARIDAELPTTRVEQDRKLIVAPGTLVITSAQLAPAVEVGLWKYLRAYIRQETASNLSFFAGFYPYLSYTMNDKLTLKTWLDTEFIHKGQTSGMKLDWFKFRPSLEWSVSKRLELAPYVSFDVRDFAARTTQLGFEFSAKLLN